MNNASVEFYFLLKWRQRGDLVAMTDQDRMKLLQEIVQAGADENNWQAILELFASWPETPAKEIAFEWCDQQMRSWPENIRVVNAAWRHLYNGNQLASLARIVRGIDIFGREQHGNTELQIITRSPYIKELKRLVIKKSSLYADGIQSLVTSPYLTSLSLLALESLTITDKEFDMFCAAAQFPSLTALRLRNIGVNTKMITRLIQSPLLKKVTKLELQGNSLDDNSVAILASDSKVLSGLEELNVSNNPITAQGAAALRQSAALKNVNIII